ncbi:MAG TPA: DUF6069 family protein [Thermomicrobiales bacterium]|nr:DUF6069 family protein [Thermomicrobiales bacterium]
MNAMNKRSWGAIDTTQLSNWQTRALAVAAAVVINVVILTIGRLVNGEFPVATVGSDDQTIGYVQVVGVTAVNGLVAWGLLALLERTTSRATTIWTAIAGIMFVLSMLGPIDGGVNTSSKIVLVLLHVGAAATIIPLMRSSSASRE